MPWSPCPCSTLAVSRRPGSSPGRSCPHGPARRARNLYWGSPIYRSSPIQNSASFLTPHPQEGGSGPARRRAVRSNGFQSDTGTPCACRWIRRFPYRRADGSGASRTGGRYRPRAIRGGSPAPTGQRSSPNQRQTPSPRTARWRTDPRSPPRLITEARESPRGASSRGSGLKASDFRQHRSTTGQTPVRRIAPAARREPKFV